MSKVRLFLDYLWEEHAITYGTRCKSVATFLRINSVIAIDSKLVNDIFFWRQTKQLERS